MKTVICGGLGFIGGYLLEALIASGDECLVMDDLSIHDGELPDWVIDNKIPDKAHLILGDYGDCANEWNVYNEIKEFNPDLIFNLAVHPLPESLEYPYGVFMTNVKITANILEWMKVRNTCGRLVQFSSSEVYGTMQDHVLSEDSPKHPTTPYAASKLACDALVESYVETFGLNAVIVRPFNAVGARQNSRTYAAVIPETIKRINEGKIPYITWDGLQRRDFTAAEDIVQGAILAAEKGNTGKTYNLCRGYGVSIEYIVTTLAEIMGYSGPIDNLEKRAGDVRQHIGDSTKARKELGWEPKIAMREMLERIVNANTRR